MRSNSSFPESEVAVSKRVPNNPPPQTVGDLNPMRETEMHPGDVERNAKLLGLRIAAGHSPPIAALLVAVRSNVFEKASSLKPDAPLAIYFDAR